MSIESLLKKLEYFIENQQTWTKTKIVELIILLWEWVSKIRTGLLIVNLLLSRITFRPNRVVTHCDAQLGVDHRVALVVYAPRNLPHLLWAKPIHPVVISGMIKCPSSAPPLKLTHSKWVKEELYRSAAYKYCVNWVCTMFILSNPMNYWLCSLAKQLLSLLLSRHFCSSENAN